MYLPMNATDDDDDDDDDMPLISTSSLHKQGAFDMDSNAIYRSLLVISILILVIALWIIIKVMRHKNNGSRIWRYDILSAKQLFPDQVGSDDSDDDLFGTVRRDDSNRLLMTDSTPR